MLSLNRCVLAALLASIPALADGAKLSYTKTFPHSVPPFVSIQIDRAGGGEYREAPDEEPLRFTLSEAEANEIFSLAEKVDYFRRPLESSLKVAFMGMKTFRYEDGDKKGETKFNYSEDLSARALVDWFERISEAAQRRIELERAAKYDKLGVVKALLDLQTSLERNRLAALQQFLPTLDRIVKNETYMHTARTRASEIAEAIRSAK